ncbi:unnamed protein product [Parascedosporium putredinis]|uniref:DUF423-domain-containing protein n=1 Tax=Parascedosporium putredinis TaxID=1442378 RepID=A0A9P1GXE1_9PEZI|nr:unnamed protein product [Parascedosporium putredinis]CAI7989615.1 unnamed protein product [Parascedosporium putredinis]
MNGIDGDRTAPLIDNYSQTPKLGELTSSAASRYPLAPSADADPETQDAMTTPIFWRIGAALGATGVALGAFGAHGLKSHISDPKRLSNWSTAAQYQLLHSGVLLLASGNPVASSLLTAGIVMFSGSLYALTLDPETFRPLGPVTPSVVSA